MAELHRASLPLQLLDIRKAKSKTTYCQGHQSPEGFLISSCSKQHHLPFQESDDILPGPPNVRPIEICSGISADKLQQASQLDVVLPQLAAVHRAADQGPIVIGFWENKNRQARLASSAPSSALPERDTQLTRCHTA